MPVAPDEPEADGLHLAVALDGAGWHPAAWREPDARPDALFTASYWADLALEAEAGALDFLTIEDSLGPQVADRLAGPDNRTDQVRGRLDAVIRDVAAGRFIDRGKLHYIDFAGQWFSVRAAWNVVTSPDAFTGENFRRGGYLERADRYERAAAFVQATRELWESWPADAVAADRATGEFLRTGPAASQQGNGDGSGGTPGSFGIRAFDFDISGTFTVPRSPQVHPVILQAGDSDGGREFAAHSAEGIFTRHSTHDAGRAFYADVKRRLARYGRPPESLKVLPGASFALGDTAAEAEEHARFVRRQQVSPLSIRDLIIEVTGRQNFAGTPSAVAEAINEAVQDDACGGFILVPHLVPAGLDEFVAKVVPLLQERGVLRAQYAEGTTLRDRMGLGPFRPAATWTAARAAAGRKEPVNG